MFETFNVPGLYIAVNSVLALAAGYTTSKLDLSVFSSFAPRHAYALRLSARQQKHLDPFRRGAFDQAHFWCS
ncbi:hypothetical protein Goshw_015213 [Gossypium schwendimanii]|uniref:Uncharacterized protein n=1 Tax=Gossypium schwendimanii TaxID=34291 RepID=A0A7J9MZ72_GOSSC|nr:hypothetical protein [Gossypium schwendimanii]